MRGLRQGAAVAARVVVRFGSRRSERQVVEVARVVVGAATAARSSATTGRRRGRGPRTGRGELAVTVIARSLLEVDEAVRGDLEGGPLLAVAALELAGLEPALHEDLVALAQAFGRALGAIAPDADPEPVGRLDPLAGLLVLRALVDRDVELGDRTAARRVAHLRIRPEVADDHHLAQGHRRRSSVDRGRCRFALGFVDPLGVVLVLEVLGRREV